MRLNSGASPVTGSGMRVLALETSCDETAAAVVSDGRRVWANVVASQIALHQRHGGVVPELAARGHVTSIIPVARMALAEADVELAEIDVIAVTSGPGLAGSLLVGVNAAKALAYGLDRPLVTVNHLEGHIYANWLCAAGALDPAPAPTFPLVCLLVSGGHTELILMTGHGQYTHLGRTLDDAAGEAFDKAARLLGLSYPGGPAIEISARDGDPDAFALPRAWLGDSHDFSFSGLKTALLREINPYRLPASPSSDVAELFPEHRPPTFRLGLPVADLAASFQAAVIEVLAVKTARAAIALGARSVLLAGGVAANSALRRRVSAELATQSPTDTTPPPVRVPPLEYCTDNAAMVAGAAYYVLRQGGQAGWEADIHPRLALVTTS